jgi:hypothetical protein
MQTYLESYGVYFRCDRRLSRAEDWYLIYQGELGISGVGVMQRADEMKDAFVDETKSFCTAGLLGPDVDQSIWNIPPDIRNAFPGAAAYRGYGGDLIEITSDPAPVDPKTDCSQYTDEKRMRLYRVSEIIDEQTLRLAKLPGDNYAPLPVFECFGQAFSYKVRASESWVARGTATGLLKRGSFQNGHCVPWIGTTAAEDIPYRNCRVFEAPGSDNGDDTEPDSPADEDADDAMSRVFENPYFRLSLGAISLPRGISREDYTNLYIKFTVANAFIPLRATIGADVTDIALAPNNDILFVDQSSNGLVVFDMLGAFSIRGDTIR